MFPTLEQDSPPQKKEEIKPEPVANKPAPQKNDKQWWQKINEIKKPDFEEQEAQKVRVTKGGKKKEKWVTVKGIFN